MTEGYRNNERNELTERVKAGSLTAYQYDKNGSIISEEEEGRRSEYRYDLLNRQTYVRTLDGREQENSYDGEGLRAGLTENGKKTTFLYHNGEILTEFDGESAPVKRYLRGVGLSHVQTQDNEAYHAYHQDEQGSTAYITGQNSAIENCYQYDAFGNLLEQKEEVSNRILYTGQQYDQETGQYYLRARYYNPVVGRFLQEDTYRGDGLNLYAYCANNPVVYYDPSGYAADGCGQGGTQKPKDTPAGDADVKWNNGWRTKDGKFASPRGTQKAGEQAEKEVWDAIAQKEGWSVRTGRIYTKDSTGQVRVYDGMAIDPKGRKIGIEVKSGSARKTRAQREFDKRVSKNNPAKGIGRSKGIKIDHTITIRR